jgi:hypothetical protein
MKLILWHISSVTKHCPGGQTWYILLIIGMTESHTNLEKEWQSQTQKKATARVGGEMGTQEVGVSHCTASQLFPGVGHYYTLTTSLQLSTALPCTYLLH